VEPFGAGMQSSVGAALVFGEEVSSLLLICILMAVV
jgi:hypothetical protein